MSQGRFLTGSTMGHVVRMTSTGALGITFVFLVDAVNLVHPPHTEALGALIDGTLAPAETWETKLTQAGQTDGSKSEAWAQLVRTRKLGYFALLRNLRNEFGGTEVSLSYGKAQA